MFDRQGQFRAAAPIGWLYFIFLYVPIVVLIVLSFNVNRTATVWEGFSLRWYEALLSDVQVRTAALHSLEIASVSAAIAVVLAVLAALGLTRPTRLRPYVMLVLNQPLIVPEIVVAVATLLFFAAVRSWLGIDLGIGNIIVAHTVFCIPLAFLPIHARLQGIDMSLIEAASDLYARAWPTFWRIVFPLIAPGILSGAMLAFIASLDNVVITSFVSGPGSTTLPIYIFGSIRNGVTPEVNAVSAVMLVVSITFVAISFLLSRIGYAKPL